MLVPYVDADSYLRVELDGVHLSAFPTTIYLSRKNACVRHTYLAGFRTLVHDWETKEANCVIEFVHAEMGDYNLFADVVKRVLKRLPTELERRVYEMM